MNDRLLVCLVLIGLYGLAVRAEDPICDNVYEACYFKTGDEDGAVQRGEKIPISQEDFLMGAKIAMEQPPAQKANVDGNPFPLISIFFYAKNSKVKRNFYFKIKNAEKDVISKTQGASLLEGDYEYPYLIITVPFTRTGNSGKPKFVAESEVINTFNDYLYSNFKKFPMNAYVDLYRNEVSFDFSSVSVDALVKRDNYTAYREDSMFKYNLRAYQRACDEVRMDSNQTAEEFRIKALNQLPDDERKTELKHMKITDFLREVNQLKRMGSFCGEIRESISSDVSCLKSNPNKCESFLRFEKITTTMYQFHFFTKLEISYMAIRFVHVKNRKTWLEIICERGKEFLEYTLIKDGKRIPAGEYLKDLQMNASLIYSTLDDLFYCGVRMQFDAPILLGNTELKFELTNQSLLELDFGSYASDKKTKISTWHTQFPLDFNFSSEMDVEWELTTFVLFGVVGGFVIILCLAVSCYMLKKYNRLSRRLTEAGSNISNMSLVSGMDSGNAASSGRSSHRRTGGQSEFITPEDMNSSMASRFNRNLASMQSNRSQNSAFSNRISSPSTAYQSSGYQSQRTSTPRSSRASRASRASRSKPSGYY